VYLKLIILYKKWEEDQQGAIDIKRESHILSPDIVVVVPMPRLEFTTSVERRQHTMSSHAASISSLEKRNKSALKLWKPDVSLAISTCKPKPEKIHST
jgi:hypothetical protein